MIAAPLPDPEIMTADEVAALLRYKSGEAVRLMTKTMGLPYIRMSEGGRGIRFRRADVLGWIDRQRTVHRPADPPRPGKVATVPTPPPAPAYDWKAEIRKLDRK
jgi:hypothetical protein